MQTPQIPANVLQLVLNETIDIATEQTGSTNLRGRCILINQISNEILLKLGYEVERRATRCDVRTDCGLFLLFGSGPASPGAIAWHAVSVHGHQWLYDFATAAYMDKPRVLVSERTFEERPHSINLRWVRQKLGLLCRQRGQLAESLLDHPLCEALAFRRRARLEGHR